MHSQRGFRDALSQSVGVACTARAVISDLSPSWSSRSASHQGHTEFDIGIVKNLIGKESAASLRCTRILKLRDIAASMKRESHVPPLFKRYIGGGRATSATVSPFTHSSALGESVGDSANGPALAIETRFARRTASRKYTRHLKRTNVSNAATISDKASDNTSSQPPAWRANAG
jgi:hypothetical protein